MNELHHVRLGCDQLKSVCCLSPDSTFPLSNHGSTPHQPQPNAVAPCPGMPFAAGRVHFRRRNSSVELGLGFQDERLSQCLTGFYFAACTWPSTVQPVGCCIVCRCIQILISLRRVSLLFAAQKKLSVRIRIEQELKEASKI